MRSCQTGHPGKVEANLLGLQTLFLLGLSKDWAKGVRGTGWGSNREGEEADRTRQDPSTAAEDQQKFRVSEQ